MIFTKLSFSLFQMAQCTVQRVTSLVFLLAVTLSAKAQNSNKRWSRQISSYTSDISDWVPLSGPVEREPPLPPIKRQAVAEPRILTEPFPGLPRPSGFSSDMFPSRTYYNAPANRQLYLQSVPAVPSAPQNYLTDQGFGQSIRFGLSQPNFPLNQGFIAPQFGYESINQNVPQTISQIKAKPPVQSPVNPVKFENFQKNAPHPHMTNPVKPFNAQLPKEVPKFVDGYRVVNSTEFTYNQKKKPQSLQKIKFDTYDKPHVRPEVPQSSPIPHGNQKLAREEVQLLYVPLESLNRGQFNFKSPLTGTQLLNTDLYSQGVHQISHKTMTELHRPIQQVENTQNYFTEFNSQLHSLQQKEVDQVPKFSTLTSPFPTSPPTTPKPKKLKPHQPPLAIFLTEEASKNNQIKVGDVLASLKTQNSVAVLDSVNPLNAPKVFIGPSSLQPPERYVKFELPYLSNIENSDKKLRQLPFFVAPLSYNTPQGFAKIPFPSPHVGSVVINSQIKETTTQRPSTENLQTNYYTGTYRHEPTPPKPATQKPTVSFYTTSPKSNVPSYQSSYYQFEPQTVSTLRPLKEPEPIAPPRPGNYFINNAGAQYNSQFNAQYDPNHYQLAGQDSYETNPLPDPVKSYTPPKVETTTTSRPIITTTTKLPSTYPSQLLETHNPYSINQAFHFSTPLDYRTYNDEYKEPIATPVAAEHVSIPQRTISTTSQTPKAEEVVTEQQRYQQQTSPQYQSYSPEIHYESEAQNSKYPVYNTNDYPKTETVDSYPGLNENTKYNLPPTNPTEYTEKQEVPAQPTLNETPIEEEVIPTVAEIDNPQRYEYNQYETNYNSNDEEIPTTSTSTTTSTTRRPLRGRGRPRSTTTPKTESSEYYTRATRKPLRERKPLPTRSRYEPNKITTEKPTRKPVDNSEEVTTKASRTRTRGRVTFKPAEEVYDRRKTHNSKEHDLAYQRDVLHQNYPVTIQERHSTVDIEAITEPTSKLTSNKELESATEFYDTENAYTYERATITQQNANQESIDDIPVFPTKTTIAQTETTYVPRLSTEEYVYHSRSSVAPAESISYNQNPTEREEEYYQKQTTPVQTESIAYATETKTQIDENQEQTFSENKEFIYKQEETTTTTPEIEVTKEVIQETEEEEENVVQTTPSYNRVRVRPGVIKQYHQASTESSRTKLDRRRPVTYRPAFDKRRTTMRIDEIQQDLKTKQVRGNPENDDYRHPVYKPEISSEATSTQEVTTKRGAIRRRRPTYSYTTSSTEGSPIKKNTYELKNRIRGRRPTTENPTERIEASSESTTTTVRALHSRYSHRPRLSERYSKKPEPEPTEETEDQDSNFSINRPTYTEPDTGKWSPKIASDSFKPYNPNNIVDEEKIATTERRSDKIEMDIITARNEYEDLLISVTPATNNRNKKKIPEIPPTLEALVEQSKVTKSDDNMSTFESMLEEVMKSLEEQDEDEYTSNVMKHKGGEIGEIPPERIISSEDSYTKATSPITLEATTVEPSGAEESTTIEVNIIF